MYRQRLTESSVKAKRVITCRKSCAESHSGSRSSSLPLLKPVLQLQRTLGNRQVTQCIQARRLTPEGRIVRLQRKLNVGAANDQYEQEADRAARHVINMPDAVAADSMQRAMSSEEDKDKVLQTMPLAASITPFVQRQPEAEEEEKGPIQAKSAGSMTGRFEAGGDVETRVMQSKGRGSSLPDPVRTYMEPRFGADFSHVRVHTGSDAIQMNRDVGAQSFTHGSDIYFGAGSSPTNLELTAHELTHVVQQEGGQLQRTRTQAKEGAATGGAPSWRGKGPLNFLSTKRARAAHGEYVGDAGRAPVVAGAGSVQRYAFVGGVQITKAAGLAAEKQAMLLDTVVRAYDTDDEFGKHATKKTDYLGNLKDGTWLRFNPTGINLLGENHTLVTAEETVPAVGSTSFIYEPFSADDLSSSPAMKAAYEKENAERFKTFGVAGVVDKKQFGEESLYPKIGFNMVLAMPYFTKARPLDELKPAGYVGQPIQRYLKISWGMTADAETKVAADRLAKQAVEPKFGKMADTHTALKAELGPFITALPLEGFLGDELTKPGNDKLLPSLAKYAKAVEDAMIQLAATDPSSRLDHRKRDQLKKKGAKDEAEKEQIFSDWRNFKFEDSVADATAKGVRYAGMGQAHLKHLIDKGLGATQHPYKMADVDLTKFKADIAALLAKAVPAFPDPAKMSTAELIKRYASSADAGEKTALEAEMRKHWIKVTVAVNKAQEGTDDVYVLAKHGGRQFKSPKMKMKSGARNTFWVPLDVLAPVNGAIAVQVFDWDALSSDDMISNINFQDPFTPMVDNKPWDDAEYETTVEFDR